MLLSLECRFTGSRNKIRRLRPAVLCLIAPICWTISAQPVRLAEFGDPATSYVVAIVAGSPRLANESGRAVDSQVAVGSVVQDGSGTIFFVDRQQIRKVSTNGQITTLASFYADTPRQLMSSGTGLVVLGFRNLYRISLSGIVQAFPNIRELTNRLWSRPGGALGASAALDTGGGNLYIASSNVVYRIDSNFAFSVFAGRGDGGFGGDGEAANQALLNQVTSLAVDSGGNLYLADWGNNRIRRIDRNGVIDTVAGLGRPGYSGDGGNAKVAEITGPRSIWIDSSDNLYFSQSVGNGWIVRRIDGSGLIASLSYSMGPSPAEFVDSNASVYTGGSQLRRVTSQSRSDIVAGVGVCCSLKDGDAVTNGRLGSVGRMVVDSARNLYFFDNASSSIRKVSGGIISTVGIIRPAPTYLAIQMGGLAIDKGGSLYFTDGNSAQIKRMTSNGTVSVIAGTGTPGIGGDGGPSSRAQLSGSLGGIALDQTGVIYVSDTGNNRIRRIGNDGTITTIAGTGRCSTGINGDGGPALLADLTPRELVADAAGNIYVTETNNCSFVSPKIRKIDSRGVLTTIVSGPTPGGLAVRKDGVVFCSNIFGWSVAGPVAISASFVDSSFNITKIAGGFGDLLEGSSGDGGPATLAPLLTAGPCQVAVDQDDKVYIADVPNSMIRRLDPSDRTFQGIVNSLSLRVGNPSAGELVNVFGPDIGPTEPQFGVFDDAAFLGTQLGNTELRWDGVPSPLTYVSQNQIKAVVPSEVVIGSSVTVEVSQTDRPPYPYVRKLGVFTISQADPALMTANGSGTGRAAAADQDGKAIAPGSPAGRGSTVVLTGTGFGETSPRTSTGQQAMDPPPIATLPIAVTVGGVVADVLFAGAIPGTVGLTQLRIRIPDDAPVGSEIPVMVNVGGILTQEGVTLSIR